MEPPLVWMSHQEGRHLHQAERLKVEKTNPPGEAELHVAPLTHALPCLG